MPKETAPTESPRVTGLILLTAIAPVVWGTTYLVTSRLLPPDHPVFAALMRTLPAGLLALLIGRHLPRGVWLWRSLVLGALNMAAFFPLLFIAAQRLPGGVAATLGAVQPLFVAFLAAAVLHEQLTRWRVGWGLLGAIGVGLVVLGPTARLDLVGVAAGLAGTISMGTGVVLTKKWGRPDGVSAVSLAGWQLTAAGLLLAVPALVFDGVPDPIDAKAVVGYTWLGLVGALLAYTLWFAGIGRLPVAPTALLGLLSPLVAALLGVLIAGEHPSPLQLLGFALALAALVCGQLPAPTHRKEPAA